MKIRRITSGAAAALLGLGLATTAALGPANAVPVKDQNVKITDQGVDFGGSAWSGILAEPLGSGKLTWDVSASGVRPILTGTIHLNDVATQWGRMHVSYWDSAGNQLGSARHSVAHQATSNGHFPFSVNFQPAADPNLVEVHICTELGPTSNGSFTQVGCETYNL